MKNLYLKIKEQAGSKHALWILIIISFFESSVFPIPPDVLLIPMILAYPSRAFLFAGVCLISSVLGGVAGYLIGAFLFEEVGQPILNILGQEEHYNQFVENYNNFGSWAVIIAGITPFPYKVITILSGFTGLNFVIFVICSIAARGLRFFLIAVLLWKFGDNIRDFIEERLGLLSIIFVIVLAGSFVLISLL